MHVLVRDDSVRGFGGDNVAEEDDFAFGVAAVDGAGGSVRGMLESSLEVKMPRCRS